MKKKSLMVLLLVAILIPMFPAAEGSNGLSSCASFNVWSEGHNTSTNFSMRPDSSMGVLVTITNNQSTPASFQLAVSRVEDGIRPANITINGESAQGWSTDNLVYGASQEFWLNISIPPRMLPGLYNLTVTAPTTNSASFRNAVLTLSITVPSMPVMRVVSVSRDTPLYLDPGRSGTVTFTLYNAGNAEGSFGVGAPGLSTDLRWTTGSPVSVASGDYGSVDATITALSSSAATTRVLNVVVIPEQDLEDLAPLPFTVVVNPTPYVSIENMSFSVEAPYTRPFTGIPVYVQVDVWNERNMEANVTVFLYDGDGMQMDNRTVILPPNHRDSITFNITFKTSGKHVLRAEINPNSTHSEPLEAFKHNLEMEVPISPLLFIMAGFMGLALFMSMVALLLVYDRMRFSGDISLSSIKTDKDMEAAGPEPILPEDYDIGSVQPSPLFTVAQDDKNADSDGEGEEGVSKKKSSMRRSERAKIKPVPDKKSMDEKPEPVPPAPPAQFKPRAMPAPPPSRSSDGEEEMLRERLKETENLIHGAKLKEMNVTSLENMHREAKKAFSSREFTKATSFLDTIERRISDLTERRENARMFIRDAQALIYGLRYTDVDLSQPKTYLTKAENAYKNSDFVEALKNAEKAMNHAKEVESSGGSSSGVSTGEDDEVRL